MTTSKSLKVYVYPPCSTCKKALKFLQDQCVAHESVHIVDSPPTRKELLAMLEAQGGALKKLFNTSGEMYRSMKLGEKLSDMSVDEALDLLSTHGKLVKRPFVVSATFKSVGFDPKIWRKELP